MKNEPQEKRNEETKSQQTEFHHQLGWDTRQSCQLIYDNIFFTSAD